MTKAPVLDHIGIVVSDYAHSKAFYAAALQPLGMSLVMELDRAKTGGFEGAGFGRGKPYFWISGGVATSPLHIAFGAATRAEVDAFHAAALAAGGKDNGTPGLRPHYHAAYYGAFVLDPDGHNVEAVCHSSE